jgi:hypothetical protein
MADWLTYKGQNPFACIASHGKTIYNEGSYLSKSPKISGGTPVWSFDKVGPAITTAHIPCGYWYSSGISYISLLPLWSLAAAWVGSTPRYETFFWALNAKFIGGGSSYNEIFKFYSSNSLGFTSTLFGGVPVVGYVNTLSVSDLSSSGSFIDVGDSFNTWPSYAYSTIEYTNGVFVKVVMLRHKVDNTIGLYSFTSTDQLLWSTSTLIAIINPDIAVHSQDVVRDMTIGKFFDGSLFIIYPIHSTYDYSSIYNKAFLMFVSSNNGASWSQVNTPDFVFSSEDELIDRMCVRVSETTYDLYVIRTKDDTDKTTYIWHTDDCGSSWNTNTVVGITYASPMEIFAISPGSSLVYAEGNLYGFIVSFGPGDEDVNLGYYVSSDHGATWVARSKYTSLESIMAFITSLQNFVNYSYIPDYTGAIVGGFMSGTIFDPGTYSFYDRTSFFVSEDFGSSWKSVSCKNYIAVSIL